MNVIERNLVGGEIIPPPSTNRSNYAERRNCLGVVLTRLAEEIDLESTGSEIGEGTVIVHELPAPEHVTENVGLMLESLPAHELERAA